jgi:hypothetical protein
MMQRHIDFYLELMATRDNVGLLYHIATKVKTVQDPTAPPFPSSDGEDADEEDAREAKEAAEKRIRKDMKRLEELDAKNAKVCFCCPVACCGLKLRGAGLERG